MDVFKQTVLWGVLRVAPYGDTRRNENCLLNFQRYDMKTFMLVHRCCCSCHNCCPRCQWLCSRLDLSSELFQTFGRIEKHCLVQGFWSCSSISSQVDNSKDLSRIQPALGAVRPVAVGDAVVVPVATYTS